MNGMMEYLRKELLELSDYFHKSERQHIINVLGCGTDEEIEALVYECNEKLEGRQNESL